MARGYVAVDTDAREPLRLDTKRNRLTYLGRGPQAVATVFDSLDTIPNVAQERTSEDTRFVAVSSPAQGRDYRRPKSVLGYLVVGRDGRPLRKNQNALKMTPIQSRGRGAVATLFKDRRTAIRNAPKGGRVFAVSDEV